MKTIKKDDFVVFGVWGVGSRVLGLDPAKVGNDREREWDPPIHGRANLEQIRQSRPESGLGLRHVLDMILDTI
jgi:hypothetical protein